MRINSLTALLFIIITIIQFIDIEGPQRLGKFLTEHKKDFQVVRVDKGEHLLKMTNAIEGVVCLGAQLLAKACDANIVQAPEREIGYKEIQLTSEGIKNILFKGVDSRLVTFNWHEDMFNIPNEGRLLASSDVCPHQAFVIGKNAYGLQFHIETDQQSVKTWSQTYISKKDYPKIYNDLMSQHNQYWENYSRNAHLIFSNMLRIMEGEPI